TIAHFAIVPHIRLATRSRKIVLPLFPTPISSIPAKFGRQHLTSRIQQQPEPQPLPPSRIELVPSSTTSVQPLRYIGLTPTSRNNLSTVARNGAKSLDLYPSPLSELHTRLPPGRALLRPLLPPRPCP